MKTTGKITALAMAASLAFALAACSPSPAEEARSLIKSGDYAGAVEVALTIADEAEQAAVFDELLISAMDVQSTLDYAPLGLGDVTSYVEVYADKFISELLSAAFSGGSASPKIDTGNADYRAAIETGDKVRSIYADYKGIITSEVQPLLSDDAKNLDTRYRELCEDLSLILSDMGMIEYLYSEDVLGSTLSNSSAPVDLAELGNDVERLSLDYEKFAEGLSGE